MGRPPRGQVDVEHFTAPLRVMFQPSQMARLKAEAELHGSDRNLSDYARKKLLDERLPAVDRRAVLELARQIRAIGNNYNQMVKQAHESVRFRLTTDLDEMGTEIRNALAKVMEL